MFVCSKTLKGYCKSKLIDAAVGYMTSADKSGNRERSYKGIKEQSVGQQVKTWNHNFICFVFVRLYRCRQLQAALGCLATISTQAQGRGGGGEV